MSFSQIQKVGAREKWTDLRQKHLIESGEKIASLTAEQTAQRCVRVISIADLLLDEIENGIRDKTLIAGSRSIREISAALKDLREIGGIRSELDLAEQKARIERLRAQSGAAEGREIRVLIDNPADLYGC